MVERHLAFSFGFPKPAIRGKKEEEDREKRRQRDGVEMKERRWKGREGRGEEKGGQKEKEGWRKKRGR